MPKIIFGFGAVLVSQPNKISGIIFKLKKIYYIPGVCAKTVSDFGTIWFSLKTNY